MSVVITSDRVPLLVWTAFNYAGYFLDMLKERRINQGIVDPFNLEFDKVLEEEFTVLRDWWNQRDARWKIPSMKLHFFPSSARRELAKEWPPPATWVETAKVLKSLALPQYPQQRVRIADPTDSKGEKRSIRVHFAEKP